MTLDSFFTHLIAFLAGAAATAALIRWAANCFVDRLLEEIEKDSQTKTASNSIRMEVELYDQQIMCYNAETKEFICQGQDLAEVFARFKQRYPGRDGVLVPSNDPAAREWIQAEMKKINAAEAQS